MKYITHRLPRFCAYSTVAILLMHSICSCNFLSVEVPTSSISEDVVFSDDATATAAIAGLYLDMYASNTSFSSGGFSGISTFAGLSSDELKNNMANDPLFLQFERNEIDPSSSYVLNLWSSMYRAIYQANVIIKRLSSSSKISGPLQKQLTGEALFVRAFCHFYLMNSFGEVPLVTSTDYTVNNSLNRSSQLIINEQIKTDLITAEELLTDEYPTAGRVRPNKATISAFLARVYLYEGDWARAEDRASKVITKNGTYSLEKDLGRVFLQNSTEAVWQLKASDVAYFTNEAFVFNINQGPQYNVLNDGVIVGYEAGDSRRDNWITTTFSGPRIVYLPYKYKKFDFLTLTNECSTVIRLAEIYLIRSEARLMQDKLPDAISDIDSIRHRANLSLIQNTNPGISKAELFNQIVEQRRIELMTEWGHRWFDLKRWGAALSVLSPLKKDIVSNDLVYPVPQKELSNNRNLMPQNVGY